MIYGHIAIHLHITGFIPEKETCSIDHVDDNPLKILEVH